MRGSARFLLLAGLALALAACSVARVAYNNAPPAIAWVVDDWFDLQEGQKDWVKDRAAKLVAWHRERELPDYERFLQALAVRASCGIAAEDARWAYERGRALYRRTIERMIPDMADFLAQVSPAQVAYLERQFDKDNEKAFAESGASGPERIAKRTKRFVDRLEDWTGSLDKAQRAKVAARVAAMPDVTEEWLADRQKRQNELLRLLKAKPTREAWIAGLQRLLVDTDAWRDPAYAAKLRSRDEMAFAMVADLDASLSPEQRERLKKKLRGYAADVAFLMAGGPP